MRALEIDVRQVPATEAKARLAELLREVENGETVAITRHGRTVAHLTPHRITRPRHGKRRWRGFKRGGSAGVPSA